MPEDTTTVFRGNLGEEDAGHLKLHAVSLELKDGTEFRAYAGDDITQHIALTDRGVRVTSEDDSGDIFAELYPWHRVHRVGYDRENPNPRAKSAEVRQ